MIIGVPKEIVTGENRIAVTPGAVKVLINAGHKVLIEAGAGEGSMIEDNQLAYSGAEIVSDVQEIYHRAEMIYKVKEPQPSSMICSGGADTLAYHLAAAPEVTRVLHG